jgi:multiple sugar transport system ATP-binding protein
VPVFLFDEPLSNLDAKLRTETRLEIKRLHDETRSTVVYVTHDQIEAMTMATRIAIMNAGVIQQFGTPDEVYDRPANLFVAGFIGAPPMNLLNGTIAVAGGKTTAMLADGDRIDLERYPFETQPRDGDAIVLGLRPEHFATRGELNGSAAATFRLPVQYTEKTGADATTYLKAGNGLVAVSIAPERAGQFRAGEAFDVSFPHDKLHVFDTATGRRL